MTRFSLRDVFWLTLVVGLALGIYMASYVALVGVIRQGSAGYPYYRVGGLVAYYVFWPVYKIDRSVRPDYWGFDPENSESEGR
jgi:hypothetical protein